MKEQGRECEQSCKRTEQPALLRWSWIACGTPAPELANFRGQHSEGEGRFWPVAVPLDRLFVDLHSEPSPRGGVTNPSIALIGSVRNGVSCSPVGNSIGIVPGERGRHMQSCCQSGRNVVRVRHQHDVRRVG